MENICFACSDLQKNFLQIMQKLFMLDISISFLQEIPNFQEVLKYLIMY
jgi:hypothetical protein